LDKRKLTQARKKTSGVGQPRLHQGAALGQRLDGSPVRNKNAYKETVDTEMPAQGGHTQGARVKRQ